MMPERKVWSTEDPFTAYGPFRANVEEFVDFFGSAIDLKQSNVTAHRIEVTDGESPSTTTLLVCRENAALEPPVCDQCRIIGEKFLAALACSSKQGAKHRSSDGL